MQSSDGGAWGKKSLCRIHLKLLLRPPTSVSWELRACRALKSQSWSINPHTQELFMPDNPLPKVLTTLRCRVSHRSRAHCCRHFGEQTCSPGCGTWGVKSLATCRHEGVERLCWAELVPTGAGGRENSPEDLLWVVEGLVSLSKVGEMYFKLSSNKWLKAALCVRSCTLSFSLCLARLGSLLNVKTKVWGFFSFLEAFFLFFFIKTWCLNITSFIFLPALFQSVTGCCIQSLCLKGRTLFLLYHFYYCQV